MSNVDPEEIARFDAVAARWWDPDGEMRPLHDLNPVRLAYVEGDGSISGREVLAIALPLVIRLLQLALYLSEDPVEHGIHDLRLA